MCSVSSQPRLPKKSLRRTRFGRAFSHYRCWCCFWICLLINQKENYLFLPWALKFQLETIRPKTWFSIFKYLTSNRELFEFSKCVQFRNIQIGIVSRQAKSSLHAYHWIRSACLKNHINNWVKAFYNFEFIFEFQNELWSCFAEYFCISCKMRR